MTKRDAENQKELDVAHVDEQDHVGTVNPAGLHTDPDQTELEELRANLADVTHEEGERLEKAEEGEGSA